MTVWLDISAAAERAGVSTPTIRRAIRSGVLKAFVLQPGGRLVRVREEDVDRWITGEARCGGQQ